MQSCLSLTERDRRWGALSVAMRQAGFDAVLFVANDYRGHKGSLRYVADFNLYHRFGYAVMRPDQAPVLHFPTILADLDRSRWVDDHNFSDDPIATVAASVRVLGSGAKIGIVGLRQAMRAGEYLRLVELLPGAVFEDATAWFDAVRLRKSPEEIAGIEEAAGIADLCFQTLLDIARPGDTERQLGARMLEVCMRAGGEDPLFLTMNPSMRDGRRQALLSPPRGRELDATAALTFSFEMIGPSGYWTEMCRMVAFTPPAPALVDTVAAGCAAIAAGQAAMRPGRPVSAIQQAAAAAVDAARYDVSGWSGHSIGQDVLETPLIGPAAAAGDLTDIVQHMALAFHPLLVDRSAAGPLFYMADIYLVGPAATRICSAWPVQLYTRNFGVSRSS